jgi:signal transduction histidine kinase
LLLKKVVSAVKSHIAFIHHSYSIVSKKSLYPFCHIIQSDQGYHDHSAHIQHGHKKCTLTDHKSECDTPASQLTPNATIKNFNQENKEKYTKLQKRRYFEIIRDFLLLANGLSEGTFIIKENGLITHFNHAGTTVIEASKVDKSNLYIHQILSVLDNSDEQHSSYASSLQKLLSKRDSEKEQKVLFSVLNSSTKIKGTVRVTTLSKSLQRAFNANCLVTLTPSGESIQESAEKRLLEEQLFRAQKVELLGQMASGIAHDFNNLLTAINCNLAVIKNESNQSLVSDRLQDAEVACSRARELVHSLLSLGRPSPLALRPVSLTHIVKEAISIVRASIDSRVAITTYLLPPEQSLIEGDSGQLNQVIINLLLNARDAIVQRMAWEDSDKHVIKVAITTEVIELNHYIVLEVCDTGIGIKDNVMRQMFEPFFTTKKDGQGTGLGLAMVSGIINRHNGSISAYNKPSSLQNRICESKIKGHIREPFDSGGCIIKILLPKLSFKDLPKIKDTELFPYSDELTKIFFTSQQNQSDSQLIREVGKVNNQDFLGGSETILVIEDEAIVREALVKMLQTLGYRVHCAADATNGLTIFEQLHEEISLVFSDFSMPDMSGIELFGWFRKISPQVPFILSSGNYEELQTGSKSSTSTFKLKHQKFQCNRASIVQKSTKTETTEACEEFLILSKPFTFNELALAIRRSLDSTKQSPL